MSDDEELKRGPYQPSIVGFVVEYQSEAPFTPLQTYSSLIPDMVLSYSSNSTTHFDLVILRFGRSEQRFNALADVLKASVRVQDIKVFKNGKNSNRLNYLRAVVFPRMGQQHHGLRVWNVMDAAKDFNGIIAFLKCLEENDITLVKEEGRKWSATQKRKAAKLLSKYSLEFTP